MTWMLTASGATVDLRFIGQADIKINDIAHALARLCRFTGHTRRHYSVAEHSLLVVDLMEWAGCRSYPTLLAGLMHDAHEAYTGDLAKPMKQLLGPAWAEQEERIQHAVLQRFGLLTAHGAARDLIKWADTTALAAERAQLMHPGGPAWACSSTHTPPGWVELRQRPTDPEAWARAFLGRWQDISYGLRLEQGLDPDPDTDTDAEHGTAAPGANA